ncbi:MAG: inositol monophosphatase family protein [Oleiphilaceae bacterium]|nr:inositol monophosphatase family protein [Oleiphilaceae bacterium]
MQPAIKMALRIARQSSDFLRNQHEKLEPATQQAESVLRMLETIEQSVYENSCEQLSKAYKDHYLAPAGDIHAEGHEKSWHVFPLLGVQNFSRGLPEFVTALLQKRNNRPEHLVLISPLTGEEYSASRGYGAALNSRRIRTANADHLNQTLISCNLAAHSGRDQDPLLWPEISGALADTESSLRFSGCPVLDLARVAGGKLDAAALSPVSDTELVLGGLLGQEAGALSGDLLGNPITERSHSILMANNRIFRECLKTLQPFRARLSKSVL